jgi:hypothetical protein
MWTEWRWVWVVVMWMVGREVAQRVNVKGVSKVFP